MALLLLLMAFNAASAAETAPMRALVLTCYPPLLPEVGEVYGYKPNFKEVSGIAIGSVKEAETLVKPESFYGGGFVEFHPDLPCLIVSNPNYVATIWNPTKTKVWCAVYEGEYVKTRDCVSGPVAKKSSK